MAETYYVHIMPHCAIGPVALAACMHVDMVVPNFLIQEQIGPTHLFDVLSAAWEVEEGHIVVPDKPGLGFEIDEREVAVQAQYEEELGGEHYYETDGSVADW